MTEIPLKRGHITVVGFDGQHKVTENLGFSHDRAMYAKAVMIDGKETIVVSRSRSGPWQINRPAVDVSGFAQQLLRRRALEKIGR